MATASVVPSGGTSSLLLERDVQVAALRALVDAAKSGGGRFVVIEGTAGIGKMSRRMFLSVSSRNPSSRRPQ